MHDVQEVDDTTGLRERKKRARREALIDATHRLAGAQGLEHVTVEAICAEVGVSVRTFFNYFGSKDDAALGMADWTPDPESAEVFAAGGPTGHLLADLQVLVAGILENPPLGPDRMARAFELAKTEPDLLVRAYVRINRQHEAVAGLARRRLGESADEAMVHVIGALMMVLSHATFERWDAHGAEGDLQSYLPTIVADLGALFAGSSPPD